MSEPAGVILIVEDSESCATTLEMAFSPLPTISARTATEALRILDANASIRAVVTDLQLPGLDGFDLIAELRASTVHAALPILVTSGDSDPSNAERLLRLGANAYFVKPYSPAAVRRTLEKLLDAS